MFGGELFRDCSVWSQSVRLLLTLDNNAAKEVSALPIELPGALLASSVLLEAELVTRSRGFPSGPM
jgi:hypothetical protein